MGTHLPRKGVPYIIHWLWLLAAPPLGGVGYFNRIAARFAESHHSRYVVQTPELLWLAGLTVLGISVIAPLTALWRRDGSKTRLALALIVMLWCLPLNLILLFLFWQAGLSMYGRN